MRIVLSPIPEGSHGVRLWLRLDPGDTFPVDKDPYDFVCTLIHVDDETCEVAQALGKLNNMALKGIGLKAAQLGYKKLTFCRPKGGSCTSRAQYVRTADNLDYYEVDLVSVLENIGG